MHRLLFRQNTKSSARDQRDAIFFSNEQGHRSHPSLTHLQKLSIVLVISAATPRINQISEESTTDITLNPHIGDLTK